MNIATSWGCSNNESVWDKALERYLVRSELPMLPFNIITNLIVSLQTGFLSFSRH